MRSFDLLFIYFAAIFSLWNHELFIFFYYYMFIVKFMWIPNFNSRTHNESLKLIAIPPSNFLEDSSRKAVKLQWKSAVLSIKYTISLPALCIFWIWADYDACDILFFCVAIFEFVKSRSDAPVFLLVCGTTINWMKPQQIIW